MGPRRSLHAVTTPARAEANTHPASIAKRRQIEELDAAAVRRIGTLGDDAFLAAGIALWAGEGSKGDGKVLFANTDARMVACFRAWLRRFFAIDESRLRARVYLHEWLDIHATEVFWSGLTKIPRAQFRVPHRATADATMRTNKHAHGCMYVYHCCSETHRRIMGLVRALLISDAIPG